MLVGRDLSGLLRGEAAPPTDPVLFVTDDEISEEEDPGLEAPSSITKAKVYETVAQPNHIETVIANVDVDGSEHTVKLSRYFDNQQFWTVPSAMRGFAAARSAP